MNWNDARVFLALARQQTLRGAARAMNVDQATVSRRVAAMEHALGSTLFLRTASGYQLTEVGESVLELAERMEASAIELVRRAQGQDRALSGEVRVTTTDSLAVDFVIPAVARLHARHPQVRITLNSSSDLLNLSRRDADIAIRTLKPDNPDLVVRRLASWPMGLFAAQAYLDAHGEPARGTAFAGHDLVMYEPWLQDAHTASLVGEPIGAGRVVMTGNTSILVRNALKAGIGLGEIPLYMGQQDGLVRLWPECQRSKPYEVWMVTHGDFRHTARIRAVIDALVQAFAELSGDCG
ncbi:LysR family transcriptional regulator [Pseudomonas japonica]|uniref:DNA-binding transcriptional regulator, LysR family n=1 Tax=Pseudomonas japonica TaxID=256466 RepID=A0A239GIU1_9PSED|nr:LysR family transcriptional regulator [Pseudomonas japonica]SNS68921.1 DNA-binding transcriptional regulator, LysR family [Pseudomonas japonica]